MGQSDRHTCAAKYGYSNNTECKPTTMFSGFPRDRSSQHRYSTLTGFGHHLYPC